MPRESAEGTRFDPGSQMPAYSLVAKKRVHRDAIPLPAPLQRQAPGFKVGDDLNTAIRVAMKSILRTFEAILLIQKKPHRRSAANRGSRHDVAQVVPVVVDS